MVITEQNTMQTQASLLQFSLTQQLRANFPAYDLLGLISIFTTCKLSVLGRVTYNFSQLPNA